MVPASNMGVIGDDGNIIIPFNNKSIRPVNDDILLVEAPEPISQSVKEAVQLKQDPLAATKLVSTPALIKDKINKKMGNTGRYLFNDQFSEATAYDINGNNLWNNEYYSFIAATGDKIYFSKNTADSEVNEYSILPPEVQSDVTQNSDTQDIDVTKVEVDQAVVENALSNESQVVETNNDGFDAATPTPNVNEGFASTDITPVALSESQIVETPVENNTVEVAPIAPIATEENTVTTSEVVDVAPIAPVNTTTDVVEDEFKLPTIEADAPTETSDVVETPIEETTQEVVDTPVNATTNVVVDTPVEATTDAVETPVEETTQEVVDTPVESTITEEVVETPATEASVDEDIQKVFGTTENEVQNIVETPVEDTTEEVTNENEEVEEASADVDLNDEFEDTVLDNMFDEVSKANDVESDMEEDIFNDIKTDSIEIEDEFEDSFEKPSYIDTTVNDTTMSDIARSMAGLINQNKELKSANSELNAEVKRLNEKVDKLKDYARTIAQKNGMQAAKIDALNVKNQSLSNKNSKYEREIYSLHNRLKGQEELTKLAQDANMLLEDSSSYDTEESYYRMAA